MFQTISESDQQVIDLAPTSQHPSLGSLFARACELHGSRTAVSMGPESVTYDQLNAAAGRVAAALKPLGLSSGSIVAIYLERSIDMVAAMLGVIQAGGAYLPIDSSYPAARVRETLADASPIAIVTDGPLAGNLDGAGIPIVRMDELPIAPKPDLKRQNRTQPDDLAYVIYTSGSTGRPKGVMVSHRNVMRLLSQTAGWFQFDEHDIWTMFHSFAFDFSVWEMWGCLLSGARLVLVPFTTSRSPDDFYALLSKEHVTVLNQTPSAFSLLIQAEGWSERVLPLALRYVVLGGEALNLRSLQPWFERHGDARPEVVNMYGITETTVHVTYRRILSRDAERERESLIGEPIPDLRIHLLDEEMRPVAEGETGEICVGGAGVSLGYLNRPELTVERFVPDPFGEEGARLYRSGDLARRRADSELVYLGRADRQVKINGFRIELGEIEAALAACPSVVQACVTAHTDADGTQRLVAYFAGAEGHADVKTLRESVALRLPAHMRPAFYIRLATLPMTANGKIDRDALPSPMAGPAATTPEMNAPGSSLEARVAAAWRRILRVEAVGSEENFFDVGGTSLLLIALRTELQNELQRTIPITWMFECTTVRALACRLSQNLSAPASISRPEQEHSPAQENARRQRNAFARMKALRSASR